MSRYTVYLCGIISDDLAKFEPALFVDDEATARRRAAVTVAINPRIAAAKVFDGDREIRTIAGEAEARRLLDRDS